jgi:5-carboxymethyl-2-hydroxymuconate isomerase
MPNLVILATANVATKTDMKGLCRALADTLVQFRDEAGKQPYPTGGIRVFAYPAPDYAVADDSGDYGFVYLNLRIAAGRSDAVKKETGDRLLLATKLHLKSVLESAPIGITLQIDQSPGQVYDAKDGSLRKLFVQ